MINRDIPNRAFALAYEIGPQSEYILRRAFFLAAAERHVDRFEIESGRLDLMEIFDRAVVAGPSKRKNIMKFR